MKNPIRSLLERATARVVLRYITGGLIAWGVIGVADAPEFLSPEIENALAVAIGGGVAWLVERAWVRARPAAKALGLDL